MRIWRHVLLALLGALVWGSSSAQLATYEGCVDASGRPVASQMDPAFPHVAASRLENGVPLIRYNPEVLPRLKPKTRLFFFAYECAHHALGHAVGAALPLPAEQQADCWAVVTLVRSGLLSDPDDIREIQSELVLPPEDWSQLWGTPRQIDLSVCLRSSLQLPRSGPPSGTQIDWNTCIRECADRLRRCQPGCRREVCDAGCGAAYGQCSQRCNSRLLP